MTDDLATLRADYLYRYGDTHPVCALVDRVQAAEAALVRCEHCGFGYSAEHSNADGTYSCPLCELAAAEAALASYASLVEVAKDVNVSLRLLPATGIDDAQRIYDVMYKILDRLARWLIDTPDYPGKPAPRAIRAPLP